MVIIEVPPYAGSRCAVDIRHTLVHTHVQGLGCLPYVLFLALVTLYKIYNSVTLAGHRFRAWSNRVATLVDFAFYKVAIVGQFPTGFAFGFEAWLDSVCLFEGW